MSTRRKGFTLLEVMIGMVLTVGSAVALFALLTQTFNMVRPMRDEVRASFIAQSEIEKLRALSESAIEAMPASNAVSAAQNPALNQLPDGQAVIYRQPYDEFHPGTSIYAVSVEVSWRTKAGNRDASVLSSIVYSQGVGK